ncbi:ATP-dependent DNA helicase [Pseudomonas sp. S2_H01]
MRSLSDIATSLFLALAARHSRAPSLADAAALIAGRTHKWTRWSSLSETEQATIAVGLRLRPPPLAQPGRFLESADLVFQDEFCPFELSAPEQQGGRLLEADRYRIKPGLDMDQVVRENIEALKGWHQPPKPVALPASGDVVLKHISAEQTRIFVIPHAERSVIPTPNQHLDLRPASAVNDISWDKDALLSIAQRLDQTTRLHQQHVASLNNIWGDATRRSASAGEFYRVNAPTGAGKSVAMVMMALDAAQRGHKVVIAVPSLVEVENTVSALKQSAAVVAEHLKVAPLHSLSRIHERAAVHFAQHSEHHPYDYACLLNAFADDLEAMPADKEPCFHLHLVSQKAGKPDTTKRLAHCPFLFKCGRTRVLSEAMEADIIVVNHHALLSGSTRIPLADSDQFQGPRSLIELLLRAAPIFLVDEIDGLLKTAIDSSTVKLELGNIQEQSSLIQLMRTVSNRAKIPGIDQGSLIRIRWALTYCSVSVDQLMNLQQRRHFEWPKKETTWPQADDAFIMAKLGIGIATLDRLYNGSDDVPEHLRSLRTNLAFWRINDPSNRPELMAAELSRLIKHLSDSDHLPRKLNNLDQVRLKASLILRGTLSLIEVALRNLQIELPLFAGAQVPYAHEVQSDLKGREPLSFSPIGPLHRTVFGFKRIQTSETESSLNVVAMRGDPHGTLLAMPDLVALGYAGVKRMSMGFSATAYFPGASAFDLKARDFIDVPDATGQVTFENVGLTTVVSGAPFFERKDRIKKLAVEIWPWLMRRLEILAGDPETQNRARLLLVATSDADAELLAVTLANLAQEPIVGWVRGRSSEHKPTLLSPEHALIYDDLTQFITGKHRDKKILVSALHPMSRGHNVVNVDGLSAIGGVVLCVRPLPSSDSPEDNLAHICYQTMNTIQPREDLGEILRVERGLANSLLNSIRSAPPAFSQQPKDIRHYTVMNILVVLTQLIGRGRRGGTPVTCYFADAAFVTGRMTWAKLLSDSVRCLKEEGQWQQFAHHHNGVASAIEQYIIHSVPESR